MRKKSQILTKQGNKETTKKKERKKKPTKIFFPLLTIRGRFIVLVYFSKSVRHLQNKTMILIDFI